MGDERFEIAVGVEERKVVFDAKSGNEAVDCFANGDAAAA